MKFIAAVTAFSIAFGCATLQVKSQEFTPFDQIHNQAELDKTIAGLDAAVFDAYNRCDLQRFATFFTDDVEFYHDQTGLAVGKANLVEAIRNNICGKTTRELVPGTLKAYHLNNYGAMEMATHRFHHPGHESEGVGEAETIMLWQYKDAAWKIARVISYDHHSVK